MEEQDETEEQMDEESAEEDAADENSAGNKFSNSLDDDDEDEQESDEDGNNRKKKKENDKDEDDDEEDDDERKDAEKGEDAEEDLDKAGEDFDDLKDDSKDKSAEQGDNTSDYDTNPDAEEPKKPEDEHGEPDTDSSPETDNLDDERKTPGNNGDDIDPEGSPEPPTGAGEEAFDAGEGATEGAEAAGEAGAETGAEAGAAGAETGAAGGEAAAAGGEAAAAGGEAAAAGGTAAAAGGEAAAAGAGGTAAAGGAVAAGPVILIVLLVILIIIIIIGVAGFFTTMPQFLWNRLKEFALSLWDGVQGYFIGMDEAGINQDDIVVAAQYLYDMGYDLVGMGFAESVEIAGQKDENGNMIEPTEENPENSIVSINAPYLRSYLVAENRTYLVNNYTFNLQDFVTSFFDGEFFSDDGTSAWGTGLINLDDNILDKLLMPARSIRIGEWNLGEALDGVKIMRDSNQMRIRRLNLELAFWNSHFDYTYYSLEGWSGRYGKPFELMVTLHVATMAPDLVKEFALNKDLDAKVNIKLTDTTTISGEIYVDGQSLTDIVDQGTYTEETIDWLEDKQSANAEEIKTAMPYISSVTNHWFRNVYFEGTDSVDASGDRIGSIDVGVDDDADGLEDYNELTGQKTQKTRRLSSDDNVYESGEDIAVELNFIDDEVPAELQGKSITIRGSMADGMVQTKDAVRGVTNPTTKEIFAGEYYIYDGTIERAKAIQAARRGENNGVKKEKVNLTKDSLQAFTILEGSDTLDAQFIYRDLKELVIEIGYFEREDFYEIERQVLEWPVPEYIPAEWPHKEIEKQVIEYGSIIACDETIAASLGISLEDLQKLTGTEDNEEDEEEQQLEELDMLKGLVFIGDDYIAGLEQNVSIEDAKFYSAPGSGPQYWLDNIATLPEGIGTVVIATGSNDPKKYESMKGLIDALDEKYNNIQMYVVEVMHVTQNHESADSYNKLIDTYNSHVRNKCKIQPNATFIDASLGFISNGYLNNGDSSGRCIPSGSFEQWAKNIARKINENNISTNDTDEQFVVDFLKAAKEVTKFVDENDFEYGSADYMPPRTNARIDEEQGTTDENGGKKISSDRMVSWALYKCGYKDQPECGLCVGEDGDFIEYCESKEWRRITSADEVEVGDIVFTGQLDDEGKKASHVFICAGEGKRYDCGSQERIRLEGSYSSYESQPFNEDIGSDFMCAYRVTGDGVINSGLKEDLDVIAMGNGRVTELLDESNNLFTEEYIARSIYGDEITSEIEEDPVEGREQTKEGIRIKLTDNALRGYVLVMYGFDVDSGISVGQEIKVGETIGKSLNSDIYIILIDKDKAVIEDVENYIKVPKKTKDNSGASPQPYEAQPGDDMLLANMMHHEGCTNTFQGSSYGSYSKDEADRINMMTGYVLINRALVNFGGHGTTIREQLLAPGQYATEYVTELTSVECLECYANAKLCLRWDCDYVKNPDGLKMTRDVLFQSGWDQCSGGDSHPGQTCFWWVDDNRNNVPDVYSGEGSWWDEFFCYSEQYRSYR